MRAKKQILITLIKALSGKIEIFKNGVWTTIGNFTNVPSGLVSAIATGLNSSTYYSWRVTATDADNYTTQKVFHFRTNATGVSPSPVNWTLASWSYRKQIDVAGIGTPISWFPLLVDITDANIAAHGLADGSDLVFTDSNDTRLNVELESYSAGHVVAWGYLDTLPASGRAIRVYYGNPAGDGGSCFPANVWDSIYLAVHHMDNPALSEESSANANNAQQMISIAGTAGKFDGSYQFICVDSRIALPQLFSSQNSFTIQAWITSNSKQGYIATQRDMSSHGFLLQYFTEGTEQAYCDSVKASRAMSTIFWHYVVARFDGPSGSITVDATTPVGLSSSITWPAKSFYIGDRSNLGRAFSGKVDELRVSIVSRSEAYVKASFANQDDPASFLVVGPEQAH